MSKSYTIKDTYNDLGEISAVILCLAFYALVCVGLLYLMGYVLHLYLWTFVKVSLAVFALVQADKAANTFGSMFNEWRNKRKAVSNEST